MLYTDPVEGRTPSSARRGDGRAHARWADEASAPPIHGTSNVYVANFSSRAPLTPYNTTCTLLLFFKNARGTRIAKLSLLARCSTGVLQSA